MHISYLISHEYVITRAFQYYTFTWVHVQFHITDPPESYVHASHAHITCTNYKSTWVSHCTYITCVYQQTYTTCSYQHYIHKFISAWFVALDAGIFLGSMPNDTDYISKENWFMSKETYFISTWVVALYVGIVLGPRLPHLYIYSISRKTTDKRLCSNTLHKFFQMLYTSLPHLYICSVSRNAIQKMF